jgi:hypothetical protein
VKSLRKAFREVKGDGDSGKPPAPPAQ